MLNFKARKFGMLPDLQILNKPNWHCSVIEVYILTVCKLHHKLLKTDNIIHHDIFCISYMKTSTKS